MTSLETVRARFTSSQGLPFAEVLTEASILEVLDKHKVEYRDRVFGPITTIWGFLSQVFSDDHSCRDAVSRVIAHRAASGLEPCSPNAPPGSCRAGCPRRGNGTGGTPTSPTAPTSPCPTPPRTRRPTRRSTTR